jgi:hypothetical protein
MPEGSHGETRGGYAPRSELRQGRFGRMFPQLSPCPCDDAALEELASGMTEPTPPEPPPDGPYGQQHTEPGGGLGPDNPAIPAGFTYLGQFIDHDVTFDPTSSLQQIADPDALVDFRTPRLDLDSIYGAGPADQPYLYDASGSKLLVEFIGDGTAEPDLARNAAGRALIGDPRNDVNLIVSQLHVLFCRAHNKLIDLLLAAGTPGEAAFGAARRELTWAYQRIVLDDYLPTVAGANVVNDVFRRDGNAYSAASATPLNASIPQIRRLFYHWRNNPFMPVEFSGAVFRFGHSQIRPEYLLNKPLGPKPLFGADVNDSLLGFRRRPAGWTIDWPLFFVVAGSGPQSSRRIDTNIVDPMLNLPGAVAADPSSVAARNLLRGCTYQLPCGQDIARAMGLPPLTADAIAGTGATPPLTELTPLWYYMLAEAETTENGEHLGPVGGRILTEVLAGLIDGDRNSFLNVDPHWRPTHIPLATENVVTMADLVSFANS